RVKWWYASFLVRGWGPRRSVLSLTVLMRPLRDFALLFGFWCPVVLLLLLLRGMTSPRQNLHGPPGCPFSSHSCITRAKIGRISTYRRVSLTFLSFFFSRRHTRFSSNSMSSTRERIISLRRAPVWAMKTNIGKMKGYSAVASTYCRHSAIC